MLILEQWKREGEDGGVLPLYTKQDLANRWGVSVRVVTNWSKRHADFCQPITGIMAGETRRLTVYPAYEVERYETVRGGRENVAKRNDDRTPFLYR